jgi:hypothetical protein
MAGRVEVNVASGQVQLSVICVEETLDRGAAATDEPAAFGTLQA